MPPSNNVEREDNDIPQLNQDTEHEPAGASHEGQLVASPALPAVTQNDAVEAVRVRKSRMQFLTGRAARDIGELSPGKLAWRQLKKNRLAMIGLWTLVFLYTIALFAPFLSPYSAVSDSPGGQSLGYHPPMKWRWREANGTWHKRPFVYLTQRTTDEDYATIDLADPNQPQVIRFLVPGDTYKMFGLIPCKWHLFGVEDGYIYTLGTDQQGRDYLSRLLYGSTISLSVGLVAISITFTLGMLVGGISGFYGGRIDEIIMRGCEVLMSVPDFYLLLALAAALPPEMNPIVVYVLITAILALVGWAGMARIIRGMTLSVREREYVEASRALGQRDLRIIIRHILPSTFTFAIVAATMSVPGYILSEAGLSFLGLGIREPMASWGNMLSAAQDLTTVESRQWILAPGLFIFITTLAFNFLGDGLRDALDPKSQQ